MFSPGTAMLGIAALLAGPCLESGHSSAPQSLATELAPHCSKAAVHGKLAENSQSGLPHLEFIIVDSPLQTPNAASPQAETPGAPPTPLAATPGEGPSVNGARSCPPNAHPEKPRLG